MRATLVIMVREPVFGAVKTRLAREVGGTEALRFTRAITARLLRRLARDRRWMTVLSVTPPRALRSRAWPLALKRRPQLRGGLGARMQAALDAPARGPVVLIGSDIPDITAPRVAAAFRALGGADAVFGPAEDGGFWLVGFRRRPRSLRPFAGARFSTPHALSDVRERLSGSRVALVATLADVDDAAGWRRWRAGPPSGTQGLGSC